MQYRAETYGPQLLPITQCWQVLQWFYWQAANVGPAFGNKLSYTRYNDQLADVAKAHPLERFDTEVKYLARVLNPQLTGWDFVLWQCCINFQIYKPCKKADKQGASA